MIFSPLALGLMLLVETPSFTWFDMIERLHLLLGGIGILLLCRQMNWSALSGLFAALVFVFGGSAAARMQHVPMIFTYAYFPFALLLLKQTLDHKRLGRAVLFGGVAGIMAAHQNHVAYLLCLALMGYALYTVFASGAPLRFLATRWPVLTVAAVTGASVLAVPLYLTLQFLPLSNRPEIPYETAVEGSLGPPAFLPLFSPDFFESLSLATYWGFNDISESYLYVGIIPAALIVRYGLAEGQILERQFRFFLIVGLVAVLYAIGSYTVFYKFAYHLLPGVDLYRRPPDATFLINIVLAMATGFLMHQLVYNPTARRIRSGLVFGGILILVALLTWAFAYAAQRGQTRGAFSDLLLALILLSGALWFLRALTCAAAQLTRFKLALLAFLLLAIDFGIHNAGSVHNAHDAGPVQLLTSGPAGRDPLTQFLRKELDMDHQEGGPYRADITMATSLWANAPMLLGIQSSQGYNPLRYALYEQAVGAQASGNVPRPFTPMTPGYDAPLLDLLGVKYIVSAREITEWDADVDMAEFPVVFEAGGITVRENPGVLPRILAATAIYIDPDFNGAITQGIMADVDYRSAVVLEHLPPTLADVDTHDGTPILPAGEGEVSARLLAYGNNEIAVAVETERDAILVLHDPYYPYWRVYVDGEERELLQANYLFRAVHVQPGDRRVVFRFEPFSRAAIKATLLRYLEHRRDNGDSG